MFSIQAVVNDNWNNWKKTILMGVRIFIYTAGAGVIDFVLAKIIGPHPRFPQLWALVGPGFAGIVRAIEGYARFHGDIPPVVKVSPLSIVEKQP
jgi:hypothetical protein